MSNSNLDTNDGHSNPPISRHNDKLYVSLRNNKFFIDKEYKLIQR